MALKRIFYASANNLGVSIYDGRLFLGELLFGADEGGRAAFSEYLRQEPDIVSYLVVDMIEEEYHNETMPHVLGHDRRSVVSRKLEQLFRTTPYRSAQSQGRIQEGRRDDRILFTALTNPDALAVYLVPMAEHKVPLAGIYSAPMLAASLLRKLAIKSDNTLLLTRNSEGFLRQTFFYRQELKNSRLSPMAAGEYSVALLAQEIEKNRRYLSRLRLLANDVPLDVVIIGADEFIDKLRTTWRDTESLRYHPLAITQAAASIGLLNESPADDCERLFVHLLSRSVPEVNYAQPGDRRAYRLYQARKALLAVSLGMVLGGAAWAGVNVVDGLAIARQTQAAIKNIESLKMEYAQVISGQPQPQIGVEEMRWAVDAGETLNHLSANPWGMLGAISTGVSDHPNIRIDEIDWSSAQTDGAINPQEPAVDEGEPVPAPGGESAVIKGQIEPFDGNLRAAFNQVNNFIETLRRDDRFSEASAVAMPLNVDPDATLAGIAGVQPEGAAAKFEIRVVLRAGHDGASH